jgi:hypothetical protein
MERRDMKLYEREFEVPMRPITGDLLSYFRDEVGLRLEPGSLPVRFVVTETGRKAHRCEVGLLSASDGESLPVSTHLFEFKRRPVENVDQFNVVFLVPTGIGAKIGGDAGDAAPVARLLATACDNLITHPNVVNASDINELPENGLYVEGSILTRLMMGTVGLQKVRANRVLLVIDEHDDDYFTDSAVNSASAARTSLGLECSVLKMRPRVSMQTRYSSSGRATGEVDGFENLVRSLSERRHEFDAVAMSSVIQVPGNLQIDYFSEDITNPWGGVEAILTHAISSVLDVPSAHSPMMVNREILNTELGVVDPRKAAEAISLTFLHCVLKGLHRSPRVVTDTQAMTRPGVITACDVSCLVIPDGCLGLPVLAAMEQGIPVIAVKENVNNMKNDLLGLPFRPGKLLVAENYLEAAGMLGALKSGVTLESVRRPVTPTAVSRTSPHPEV